MILEKLGYELVEEDLNTNFALKDTTLVPTSKCIKAYRKWITETGEHLDIYILFFEDDRFIKWSRTYDRNMYISYEELKGINEILDMNVETDPLRDKLDIVKGIIVQFKNDVLEYSKGGINNQSVSVGLIGEKIKQVLKELNR